VQFDIRLFFKNMLRKFNFYYNLTKITATYTKSYVHLWSYLANSSQN